MSSHRLNDRGTSLLVALTLFGACLICLGQKFEQPQLSACQNPALVQGQVNCEGLGEPASDLFLLFDTKLDLNLATAQELDMIPKLQKKVAQAIVDRREELGSFSSYEQIDDVKGIGPKMLEVLKAHTFLGR